MTTIKTKISSLIALRNITNLQKKSVEENKDIKDFLKICSKLFHGYLDRNFKDDILFYCLSTIKQNDNKTEEDQFEFINYDNNKSGYYFFERNIKEVQDIKILVEALVKNATENQSINFTKVILGKRNTQCKDLFFTNNVNHYEDILKGYEKNIFTINFNDLIVTVDVTDFITKNGDSIDQIKNEFLFNEQFGSETKEIKQNKIASYLFALKSIQTKFIKNNPGKDFLIHYIRPSIPIGQYNLMLTLALNRPFTEEELGVLNLLLYRATAATSMTKMQKEVWENYLNKNTTKYTDKLKKLLELLVFCYEKDLKVKIQHILYAKYIANYQKNDDTLNKLLNINQIEYLFKFNDYKDLDIKIINNFPSNNDFNPLNKVKIHSDKDKYISFCKYIIELEKTKYGKEVIQNLKEIKRLDKCFEQYDKRQII